MKVLLILDTQNLYYSARSLYGQQARIDFRQLKQVIVDKTNAGLIRPIAFISKNKSEDSLFVSFLKKIGYDIEKFDSEEEKSPVTKIKSLIENEGAQYDVVAVCSGNGDLKDSYEAIKDSTRVVIFSFRDSLSKVFDEYEVVYLDHNILMNLASDKDKEEKATVNV